MNENKTKDNVAPTSKQTELAKLLAKEFKIPVNGNLDKNPELQLSIIKEYKPQLDNKNINQALETMANIRENPDLAKEHAEVLAEKGIGSLDKSGNFQIDYKKVLTNFKALDSLKSVEVAALKELAHLETARDLDRKSPPKTAGMAYIDSYIERGDSIFRIELKEHERHSYLRKEMKKNNSLIATVKQEKTKSSRRESFTQSLANENEKGKSRSR